MRIIFILVTKQAPRGDEKVKRCLEKVLHLDLENLAKLLFGFSESKRKRKYDTNLRKGYFFLLKKKLIKVKVKRKIMRFKYVLFHSLFFVS